MARLPTPGSDTGNWGDILNDYLLVSHNTDGTLRAASDIADAKAKANSALQPSGNLSGLQSPAVARTNLGLGNISTHASTDFDAAGSASSALADAKTYTNQQVATISSAAGEPTLPLFNVESYGAVGDGTTDDYAAIKAAWDAMAASPNGGLLVFPSAKVYRVDASVAGRLHDAGDGSWALFPFPVIPRDSTHSKLTFGIQGVGDPISPRIYINQTSHAAPVLTGTVLQVDYSTPFSFDSTHGLPSVFGCADVWKGSNAGFNYFNNIHVTVDKLTIRQPYDPSLMCLNLASASAAQIGKVAFDVAGALDQAPEPTHPSGGTLLLPKTNNNVTAIVDEVYAWGYYAGPAVYTEHVDIRSAIIVRCKIAAPIPWGSYHFGHMNMLSAEQCPWVISGYDPTATSDKNAGVVAIPTNIGAPTWKIEFIDIESTDYIGIYPWMRTDTAGATVYDPGNSLQGMAYISTNYVEAGHISDDVYTVGASKFRIWGMINYDANGSTRAAGHAPVLTPTQAPDAPTITSVTAGNASATVYFTPASTGGTATSYTVTTTPGGMTATGSSSPIALTGLSNDTSYTATVHATNAVGSSAESSPSSSFTPVAGSSGTVIASQTFTGADGSAVPNDDQGDTWTAPGYEIHTNTLYAISGNQVGAAYVDPAFAGDVSVSATYPSLGPVSGGEGFDGGPALKISDQDNMIWSDISYGDGDTSLLANIFARVGGVNTAMGTLYSGAIPSAGPHTVTLSLQAGTLTLSIDGNAIVTCTDTSGLTGAGVGVYKNGGTSAPIAVSEFTATAN